MAFSLDDVEAQRRPLTGHCYRMLGSVVDADDATQETIIRAWKNAPQFDGRSSLRTWLYRIATNVCLDEIAKRGRRLRPMDVRRPNTSGNPSPDQITQRAHSTWVEPISDECAISPDAGPAERAMMRQSIRLAFVAALQHLAPKQRAVLLLVDVLGWTAADAAETLETSIAAVNSALQRARSMVPRQEAIATTLSANQQLMLDKYVVAFERYDMDALVSVLREDATLCMPPFELWFQGAEAIRTWMLGLGIGCRGSRLIATCACASPAFAQYRVRPDGGYWAWSLIVLDLADEKIAGIYAFLNVESLFPRFQLPLVLPFSTGDEPKKRSRDR